MTMNNSQLKREEEVEHVLFQILEKITEEVVALEQEEQKEVEQVLFPIVEKVTLDTEEKDSRSKISCDVSICS